jgi:hypothetical protein
MTSYDVYVTAHVCSAVAWVGSSTMTELTARRIIKRSDGQELKGFVEDLEHLAPRFFIPISLLTVVFGAVSVWRGPFTFSDPWVDVGLSMFVVSFLIGLLYLKPRTEKLGALAAAGGQETPEFGQRLQTMLKGHALELTLLYATVVVMVIKPG